MTRPPAIEIPSFNSSSVPSYLTRGELYACVQVSKAFRDAYIPYLWDTIHFDKLVDFLSKPTNLENFTSGLWHNGSHVRRIICERASDNDMLALLLEVVVATSCRNVTHLCTIIAEKERPKGWHRALIKNNKNLCSLVLGAAEASMDLIANYLSLSTYTHLKDIQLDMEDFCDWTSLLRILDRCPALVSLTLNGMRDVLSDFSPFELGEPSKKTGIQELTVSGRASADALLHLMPACPKLTHLRIDGCFHDEDMYDMSVALSRVPSSLTHLALVGNPECAIDVGLDTLTFIAALMHTSLRAIVMDGVVAPDALDMIRKGFKNTLEVLVIESYQSFGTDVVRDLLAECPRLRILEIIYVDQHSSHFDAWELVKKPWACWNLEILRLPIGGDPKFTIPRRNNANSDPRQILRILNTQLAKLPNLRCTIFSCRCRKTVMSQYNFHR
ncbi:hypothetical protein BGW42_007617 [Actinomortierella wolfii]|nr:hypothetical protein BGW42_007617 [Actinomortierella wolfii]